MKDITRPKTLSKYLQNSNSLLTVDNKKISILPSSVPTPAKLNQAGPNPNPYSSSRYQPNQTSRETIKITNIENTTISLAMKLIILIQFN